MRLILFFLLITLMSCSQKIYSQGYVLNSHLYGKISNGLPEKDTIVIQKYANGVIKSKGKYALTIDNQLSNIKVGTWREFYRNGPLKIKGKFKIGSYLECCTGGGCKRFYPYKSGNWKFYNQDGKIKYKVKFAIDKLYIETNCEGGDSLKFGLIEKVPSKYKNILNSDKISELEKVEVIEEYWTLTYLPKNNNLEIEFNKINKKRP